MANGAAGHRTTLHVEADGQTLNKVPLADVAAVYVHLLPIRRLGESETALRKPPLDNTFVLPYRTDSRAFNLKRNFTAGLVLDIDGLIAKTLALD